MKGRVILLGLARAPAVAALVVDGRMEDVLIDAAAGRTVPAPGEVYWAVVDRLAGKTGAFVRLTPGAMGYLRDIRGVRPGDRRAVQVTGFAEPGKASPVAARLLHKGRFLILTPDAPGVNISRRIRNEARRAELLARVEAALSESGIDLAARGGLILRSAAEVAEADEIAGDLHRLLHEAAAMDDFLRDRNPPLDHPAAGGRSVLAAGLDLWAAPRPDAVVVDSPVLLAEHRLNPLPLAGSGALERMARLHDGADMLDDFGVSDAVAALRSPRADLPSGGWMSVEPTRALVAVDVNTGDNFSPAAALTANIEAARELPRQLRLRGLGGQVTVDFAPLRKMDRRRIEEVLKAAFRHDPVETTLAGWTPLGAFELQRKRERRPLADLPV